MKTHAPHTPSARPPAPLPDRPAQVDAVRAMESALAEYNAAACALECLREAAVPAELHSEWDVLQSELTCGLAHEVTIIHRPPEDTKGRRPIPPVKMPLSEFLGRLFDHWRAERDHRRH